MEISDQLKVRHDRRYWAAPGRATRNLPVNHRAMTAYRAPAWKATSPSGKNRYVTQTGGLIEAEHQVHALHTLTGRTFNQIVFDDQNDK